MSLLRLFVLVSDRGSIAGAARDLGISPSLATRRLAALEQTLQARLFQRTTRSVKLTEPGAVALGWARQTLETYEELTDNLGSLVARPSGVVRLVMNHYAATTFLPGILPRFCREYPDIRLAISTNDSIVDLVEGGYDLAVHSGRVPDSSVVGVRITEFRRVVCATPGYLERFGVPSRPEELAAHRCLIHSTNEPKNWFFSRGKRLISQPVSAYIEADSHSLLLELVRSGLGIARIAHNLVRKDLEAGRLVELLPEHRSVYSNGELPGIWLLYPTRKVLFRTRVLIDFLTRELAR